MSVRTLCNRTVDVKTVTRTKDARGTWTEVTADRYASMPCRIQPVSGQEAVLYDRRGVDASHKLFTPGGYTGIKEHDRIVDGSDTYDVQLARDIDLMGHHVEVLMRLVREAL